MYWGSVRFFKHLILLIIFGSFAAAIVLAVFWGVKYHTMPNTKELQQQVDVLQLENREFLNALQKLKNGSPEKFLAICKENGVSVQEVLNALQQDSDSTADIAEQSAADGSDSASLPSYAASYQFLYVDPPKQVVEPNEQTIYLTFDNGATATTDQILDILDQYNIKATFFVSPAADGSDIARLKRIRNAGHTIGLRPTVNSRLNYTDVQGFLDDFAQASQRLYNATGIRADIFRFPGGSINDYNQTFSQELIQEMKRRGYVYFDWNVDCGQTEKQNKSASEISQKIIDFMKKDSSAVVLLYDDWNCDATVGALPLTIQTLAQQGYTFDRLTNTVQPVTFEDNQLDNVVT